MDLELPVQPDDAWPGQRSSAAKCVKLLSCWHSIPASKVDYRLPAVFPYLARLSPHCNITASHRNQGDLRRANCA